MSIGINMDREGNRVLKIKILNQSGKIVGFIQEKLSSVTVTGNV